MKKALILTLVLLTGVAFAESLTILDEDFESYDTIRPLSEQSSWIAYQGHESFYVVSDSGSKRLRFDRLDASSGDRGNIKEFTIDPKGVDIDVIISFKFKLVDGQLNFGPFENGYNSPSDGHLLTLFINKTSVNANLNGGYYGTLFTYESLDPNKWYKVEVVVNPVSKKIKSIKLGNNATDPSTTYDYLRVGDTGIPKGLIFYSAYGSSTDAYIDDVMVEAVPEPACLGLLALAGLFLLRKRS